MPVSACARRAAAPICSADRGARPRRPVPGPQSSFDAPKRLVGATTHEDATVYTVRISTDVRRGSALSEPSAGVMLCLIGADGSSVLRRVSPLVDPAADAAEVLRICGAEGGAPPGANCSVALDVAARRAAAAAAAQTPARRFQEGAIEEISFLAPELGPLSAVIVAPEAGTWRCEELDVSSSRSGDTCRFVCRDDVGDRGSHAAAYLLPLPPGGVVYGSGDAAVVITSQQAAHLREWDMQRYSAMKQTLLSATATLVCMGSWAVFAVGGAQLATPFALGGISSLAYQYLLQRRVDGVAAASSDPGPPASEVRPGPQLSLALALSDPATRAAMMSAGLLSSLVLIHAFAGMEAGGEAGRLAAEGDGGGALSAMTAVEVRQAAAGLAGFMMQKVAVIAWSALPDRAPQAAFGGGASKRQVDDRVE